MAHPVFSHIFVACLRKSSPPLFLFLLIPVIFTTSGAAAAAAWGGKKGKKNSNRPPSSISPCFQASKPPSVLYLPPSCTPPLPKGIIIHRTKKGGDEFTFFGVLLEYIRRFQRIPSNPAYTCPKVHYMVKIALCYLPKRVHAFLARSPSSQVYPWGFLLPLPPPPPFLLVFLSEAAEGEEERRRGGEEKARLLPWKEEEELWVIHALGEGVSPLGGVQMCTVCVWGIEREP